MAQPDVALIMPFRNEAAHLERVLASLRAQGYPHARVRLIAVDNGSNDEGPAILERWLREGAIDGEVRRLLRPSIPAALNAAIAAAPTDCIVVRIDAHTLYPPDYLERIVDAFTTLPAEVWCVGGAELPIVEGGFGTALHGALFTNPLGLGPAPYRRGDAVADVASVYLGAWRPGVLQRVGGYDEHWRANEDAELAQRIRDAGGRVVRIPVRPRKILTRGARGALRQWSRYGYWRARTLARHPHALHWRHLAPPGAVVAAGALAMAGRHRTLAAGYVAFAAATIALRARDEDPAVTAATLVYFPLVHAGFGVGMILGFADAVRLGLKPHGAGTTDS